jgi:glycosyltransferase involved in cell wall biosynthesis
MLAYLIENPGVAEASGRASRELIQREYTWDKVALRTHLIYSSLLRGDREAGSCLELTQT